MKNAILAIIALTVPGWVAAQIPNPDFEQWQTTTVNRPVSWTVFGRTDKVPGYKSNWAVRITRTADQQSGPGAVVYGNPENGFQGGVPFAGRPDSVVGFFKMHIVPDDTAWFVSILKRGGNIISMHIFELYGGDSTKFVRYAYRLDYSDTGKSDSVILGVSSTNPDKTMAGSWVVADSLHYKGGGVYPMLPNTNFETWNTVSYDEPLGWLTLNNRISGGTTFPVTKSTDKVFGNYAVKVKNIDLGTAGFLYGYVMAGRQGDNGLLPGFKMTSRDTVLYVNYKFSPLNQDTLNIGVIMFNNGQMVGTGFLIKGGAVTNWTQAAIKVNYDGMFSGIPDSAAIFCAAFQGGEQPTGESVLYVDGIRFNQPFTNLPVSRYTYPEMYVYPNPATSELIYYCRLHSPGDIKITMYSLSGYKVLEKNEWSGSTGEHTGLINVSNLAKGTYVFEIINGNKKMVKKVVVN